jgi:UDP-N-acetylmuramyl pentapeptide phosphotransferase/UDP-N-acetylglucosamine-1-phosphate transferase
VPIFDMTLVVFSRLRRKRPIQLSSRDHTYHRLLKMNLDSNRAVLLMHVVALFLSCLAAISLSQTPLIANSIFLFVVLIGLAAIVYLDQRKRWP